MLVAVVDCGGTADAAFTQRRQYLCRQPDTGRAGRTTYWLSHRRSSAVTEKCIVESDYKKVLQRQPNRRPQDGPKSKTRRKEEMYGYDSGKKKGNHRQESEKGVTGNVVRQVLQAGRETIEMIIKQCFHLLAFTSTLLRIISASRLKNIIADKSHCAKSAWECRISPYVPSARFCHPSGIYGLSSRDGRNPLGAQFALETSSPVCAAGPVCHRAVGGDYITGWTGVLENQSRRPLKWVFQLCCSRGSCGPYLAVLIAFAFSIGMY